MKKITRRRFLQCAGGLGALGLVASYPVLIERHLVWTNTYRIPVPNLPQAFSGFRLVQLTDLHHGFLVSPRFLQRVIRRANRIEADAIICTGDYVKGRKIEAIDEVWPLLAELKAPSGVFSILGNHDHWADTERSQYWLNQTGQNLRHRSIPFERDGERLWITGAGDLWTDHKSLDELLKNVPKSDCRIVLAHNPDTADSDFSTRVDLMISGHTHGGQVCVPFYGPPVLPVRNKTYSSGLKASPRGTKVFISRGIGWSIYPIRFNCFPEIAVLELVPE